MAQLTLIFDKSGTDFLKYGISLCLCSLLPLASGCNEQESADTRSLENSNLTEILRLEINSTRACPTQEIENDPERKLLSFEISLDSNEVIPINYRYASLITKDGNRYLAEHFGCKPLLNGPPITKGKTATGFLNFALPAAKLPTRIEYSPDLSHLRYGQPEFSASRLVFEVMVNEGKNE